MTRLAFGPPHSLLKQEETPASYRFRDISWLDFIVVSYHPKDHWIISGRLQDSKACPDPVHHAG